MLYTVLKAIICFPLLFFIPGHTTLRAFRLKERDLQEALFLSVLSSVLLSSWFGLVLAEVGRFSLLHLLLSLVIYSGAVAIGFRVKPTWSDLPKPQLNFQSLLLIGVILIAGVSSFRPFESILGTSDAGVYIGMGVNIAKTGAIRTHDPLLADLTGDIKYDLLYPYRYPSGFELMRFFGDGVRIWDMEQGIFFSQQNNLYQVWIATFYSIFGMKRGVNPFSSLDLLGILGHFSKTPMFLYVTPLFGLLGVVSLYLAGRALFDRNIGLLASFLLAINIAQIWFSRWAMSEVLTQFLIFGAIYSFTLYIKTSHRYFGLVSGVALGVALLSRVDAVFLVVPVALFFAYLRVTRKLRLEHWYFFAPFAFLFVHWLIHTLLFSRTHIFAIGKALLNSGSIVPLVIGGGLLITALLIFASLNSTRIVSALTRSSVCGRWIRLIVTILLVFLALYAYFIRPNTSIPQKTYYQPAGGIIRTYNEENLVRLGWYISPLGLLLSLAGLLAIIWEEANERTMFFVGIALIYSFAFLHSAFVSPIHIYWVRRYLIIVIPSMMLFISYALFRLRRGIVLGRLGDMAAIALGATLVASFAYTSLVVANCIPYQGLADQMDRFAKQLSDKAVVIFESPFPGNPFALPLTYIYDRDSFVLQGQNPNNRQFFDLVKRWQGKGREVFYIAHDGLIRVRSDDYVLAPVGEISFDIPLLEMSFDRLPRGMAHHLYDLEIYRIEPVQNSREDDIYPFSLDVGKFDCGYLMNGFYFREKGPNGSYRWTAETAEIIVPWRPKGNKLALLLRIGSPRPEGVEPARVSVYLHEILIDEFDLGNEFKTHQITVPLNTIPDSEAKEMILRLETNSWIPAEMGLGDTRELGIVLDWLRLEEVM